jgi:hypothetical protein
MEFWRWHLAEKFGWHLDYVDTLTMRDFHEYLQVTDGESKARGDARTQTKARR